MYLFALPLELEVLIHQATNLFLQLLHIRLSLHQITTAVSNNQRGEKRRGLKIIHFRRHGINELLLFFKRILLPTFFHRPGAERGLPVLHHPDVLALVVAIAAAAAVAAAGPSQLQIQAT